MERPLCDHCDKPAEYRHYQSGLDFCADHAMSEGQHTEPGRLMVWDFRKETFV